MTVVADRFLVVQRLLEVEIESEFQSASPRYYFPAVVHSHRAEEIGPVVRSAENVQETGSALVFRRA